MVLKVSTNPAREWDQFVSQYSGLIFHFSVWGQILQEAFGGELYYYYLEKDGRIVCGMPGIVLDFKLARILYSIISYGGVIGKSHYIPAFIELLNQEVMKQRIHQVKIQGTPDYKFNSLVGFETLQGVSHILDIDGKNEIEVQQQYSKGTRRDIRKAERLGIRIRSIEVRGEVTQFYRLYLASMQRQGILAKYPEKLFYAIFDRLMPIQKADFLFACYKDQLIAGTCLLYSTGYAHYFMGGSIPQLLRLQPNEFLLHHAIATAIKRKIPLFDFMGSPPNDENLIRFKEKWGSRAVVVNTHVRSLNKSRCALWNLAQRISQTRLGSRLYGFIYKQS